MNNSLLVIFPYKSNNVWAFDDERVGLFREPFVAGIDEMLDEMTKNIKGAQSGEKIKLVFSPAPFPNYNIHLEWQREDCGGNWYYCEKLDKEGWLCPALYKYFDVAPANLYGMICEA